MKKRHIGKVNIFPKKEKEMLKFLNDPKVFEKLSKLSDIANTMSDTQKAIEAKKFDNLEEWLAFSLTRMSPSLFASTEDTGFQKELQELIINYERKTINEDETNKSRTSEH